MKVIARKIAVRKVWSNHPSASGVLLERDIGVGHGRLKAKLIVFKTSAQLRAFWKDGLGRGDLGRYCLGAVNGLYLEIHRVTKKKERRWLEVDPRYFCVIGLTEKGLSMEIVCHESVHAAFSFAKRKSRSPWDALIDDFDEEAICYPAGRIARSINRVLFAAKLYK